MGIFDRLKGKKYVDPIRASSKSDKEIMKDFENIFRYEGEAKAREFLTSWGYSSKSVESAVNNYKSWLPKNRPEPLKESARDMTEPWSGGLRGEELEEALKKQNPPSKPWYPGGFWTPRVGGFKVNIGKFLFTMLVIAGSLVIPFIFKESGSAWYLSFAISLWAIGTLFPSHLPKTEAEEGGGYGTAMLMMKASLNGTATIFLSLGLLAISPSTPFMRLLTLVVFTIAYLSFPTGGGDDKYKAYLASWRMFLGFYFMVFFIFAFINVLSVSPLIFVSLAALAFAFYFNLPDFEIAESIGKSKPFQIINKMGGGESPGGMIAFGIMMMVFGATMALFLGNMASTFLFFPLSTWAALIYFAGIMVLLMGSASGSTGETVLFSGIASIGLAIGAFDLWVEHHYFAAMGYNILVGMSVASGAASQQARPIIGVTALSFAIIILSSAYPAVLGEAVFGAWWPQIESGVTTVVGPMSLATAQMGEGFQNAFLMFSCPSCYYEKQLQQQQTNANLKSGGTAKSIDVSDFTFQVVNIPEQPLLATATLENKGEFTATNIQTKLKVLQTKNKKGAFTDRPEVNGKFVTCSGTTPSGDNKDTCSWAEPSYNGDQKQVTFTYGYKTPTNQNPWGSALGRCSCYNSDGKLKGYCLPATDGSDSTGCKKCANFNRVDLQTGGVGLGDLSSSTCDLNNKDTIGYDYGGWSAVVGFDYSFDYIVNVSLDTQLMQSNTLNDLLLKKQITLQEITAEYSGGPVKASIWTQKQPVRASEDTLAVISVENQGTGTVKVKDTGTCKEAGGLCEAYVPGYGNCASGEKELIGPSYCAGELVANHCCIPNSKYNSIGAGSSDYTLIIPFISGIKPSITEVSRGGLDCGNINPPVGDVSKLAGGKGMVAKSDSFELHCSLESNLEKGKFARYAFTFNYVIPPEIDSKSVIFVGNVNYQYQNSYTKEATITWAPPQ